jgi:hypothetical protein
MDYEKLLFVLTYFAHFHYSDMMSSRPEAAQTTGDDPYTCPQRLPDKERFDLFRLVPVDPDWSKLLVDLKK